MRRTNHNLDDLALTLPMTQAACRTAQQFANQQPTPEKAEQVRLNTLCVWVVNEYLEMMDIPTQLTECDSWNSIIRLCSDVADLELPGIGRLECRPMRLGQETCYIPPETWEERVGYVVVQIDESLQQAKLLGFVRNVATEELPLSQLQPLEDFIEYIAQLRQTPVRTLVNLSQWLVGIFDASWQTVESLWNQPEIRPGYAFRNGETLVQNDTNKTQAFTKRAKLIDLGIQIANQPVILIVEIRPKTDQQTGIRLQLHPTGNKIYLIPGVQLTVLDQSGTVFLETQARSADNYLQLQFRGEPAEQFSVKVSLNDASVTQNFII
ncbi:MAG: DUF1822 family protein [Brasilonema angustatum HA4187-MV1]|jgi:hypothetical protein|nr:DUF1822 family protein [Brasilonema angustatum HA4187-MV1]